MPEILKPVAAEVSPEMPRSEMFDTLVLTGRLDNNSEERRLDADSSMGAFTGAIIEGAGATHSFIIAATSEEAAELVETRLNEVGDIDNENIIIETGKKPNESEVDILRRALKKLPKRNNRIGILTSTDPRRLREFAEAGINLEQIPAEDILNETIATKTARKPKEVLNIMIEMGQHYINYHKLMSHIGLFQIKPSRAS